MGSTIGSNGWFVAETRTGLEARSRCHLERQSFDCFLPRFRKLRRHARRVEQVLAPIFPGYIFVRFDPSGDHWGAINSTFGVKRLISFSEGRPQRFPDGVVEALQSRCTNEVLETQLPVLRPGQVVRLVDGPLANQLATIEALDSQGRVMVLLELLGGTVSTRVPRSHLGVF